MEVVEIDYHGEVSCAETTMDTRSMHAEIEQLRGKIATIFRDVLDRDDLVLTDNLTAEDVEEWDSLSHVRLMVAIERELSVRFSNAEIEMLHNVGDLLRLVAKKVGGG